MQCSVEDGDNAALTQLCMCRGFRFSQIPVTEQSWNMRLRMVWREDPWQLRAVLMKVTLVISQRWARGTERLPEMPLTAVCERAPQPWVKGQQVPAWKKRELQGNQHGWAESPGQSLPPGQGCVRAALFAGNSTPELPPLCVQTDSRMDDLCLFNHKLVLIG